MAEETDFQLYLVRLNKQPGAINNKSIEPFWKSLENIPESQRLNQTILWLHQRILAAPDISEARGETLMEMRGLLYILRDRMGYGYRPRWLELAARELARSPTGTSSLAL